MFQERDDRWVFDFRGERVDSVASGAELVIRLDSSSEITVNGNALITQGSIRGPEAVPVRVADMTGEEHRELVGATIASAVAFKSGWLRVVFSTGLHINVRDSDSEVSARVRRPGCYDWSYDGQSVQMVIHAS